MANNLDDDVDRNVVKPEIQQMHKDVSQDNIVVDMLADDLDIPDSVLADLPFVDLANSVETDELRVSEGLFIPGGGYFKRSIESACLNKFSILLPIQYLMPNAKTHGKLK